uniref:Uncharacterized protein n=1 Tax=Ciona savignyi TaxID=51511 RepID=H2ZNR7_CIOSA
MESMEAYYHQVMKREQDCEVPQTFGGFDFSSFSQNMQTNQAAVMNAKQSVLPMTPGYNNNGQWKGRPQQELNLICGHSTGNQIIYNDNTQHQSVEQHSSPNFNMLQQVSPRQFPSSLQQPASVQQQNNLQVKVEALDQVLMQRTSFTSTQESLVNNQHQKLDSQQEQVMAGSEYGEENFDSQIVHAFLWIEAKLCAKLKYLSFCDRVAYVYNPLEYAADPHAH